MKNNEKETEKEEFKRECPECEKELFYKNKNNLNTANKLNRKCKTCSFTGKVGLYERTQEIKDSIGSKNKGRKTPLHIREKISKARKGKKIGRRKSIEEQKQTRKIYNEKNKEKIKEYTIKYKEKNKELIQQKQKIYNKNKLEDKKKYLKIRYKNDILFKTKVNISNRIRKLTKNIKKSHKNIKYLGCSIEEFKLHLEKQFLPEMSWENHGTIWEIDHIIPCASFDLTIEENIFKCFHYSNHQPLFKTTEIAESFGYVDQIGNRNKGKNT